MKQAKLQIIKNSLKRKVILVFKNKLYSNNFFFRGQIQVLLILELIFSIETKKTEKCMVKQVTYN